MQRSASENLQVPTLTQRAEFVAYRPGIHEAHNQSRSSLFNALKSFSIHFPNTVDSLVEVSIKHMNRFRCVSNELYESMVGHVVKRDGIKAFLKSGEPKWFCPKIGRLLCSSSSLSKSSSSVFGCRIEDRKVGVDLFALSPSNLIEGQTSGIDDRHSGQDCLCPSGSYLWPPAFRPHPQLTKSLRCLVHFSASRFDGGIIRCSIAQLEFC